MTDAGTDDGAEESGGLSRRTLVRLLVGGGVGIPLAIEARTLYGLAMQTLSGGPDEGDGSGGEPATETDEPTGVGVGGELLPATEPAETVTNAVVSAGERWTFLLAVEVENRTELSYELRVEAVRTADERIADPVSTGAVQAGESSILTGRWTVPAGSVPTAVEAVGIVDPDGSADRVARTVRLDTVPVRRDG